LSKRPPKFRYRFDKNGHRVLVGLSAEQTFEFERTRRTGPLGRTRSSEWVSVVTFGATVLAHDWVNSRDRDVHIGNNCFIGANAIVLPGVTIGDQCIVAAASVVARDVPSGSLVAGNPARVVERDIKTGHYGVRVTPELCTLNGGEREGGSFSSAR